LCHKKIGQTGVVVKPVITFLSSSLVACKIWFS